MRRLLADGVHGSVTKLRTCQADAPDHLASHLREAGEDMLDTGSGTGYALVPCLDTLPNRLTGLDAVASQSSGAACSLTTACSSAVLRWIGARTMLASMICPSRARNPCCCNSAKIWCYCLYQAFAKDLDSVAIQSSAGVLQPGKARNAWQLMRSSSCSSICSSDRLNSYWSSSMPVINPVG